MTRLAVLADIHSNLPALEAVLDDLAAFKVDQGSGFPHAQIGPAQGFFHGGYPVKCSIRHAQRRRQFARFHDGEANAIVTHALVHFQFAANGRNNGEVHVGAVFFDFLYGAEGFYNAGKHLYFIF